MIPLLVSNQGGGTPTPTPTYLPTVASSPIAAYGAKRLIAAYSGPIFRLVRASDSATLDVSPASGSDKPDYAAIATWIGASSAAFDIVYDQTGSGNHATQTVAANRPTYVPSRTSGGVVGISFDTAVQLSAVFKWFDLPTTISFDRLACSVAFATDPNVSVANNVWCEWQNAAGTVTDFNMYVRVDRAGLSSGGNSTKAANILPRMGVQFLGLSSGPSNLVAYAQDTSENLAVHTAAGTGIYGGWWGKSVAPAYTHRAVDYGFVIYGTALNATDMGALRTAMQTMFAMTTSFTHRIIIDQDSLGEGIRADNDAIQNAVRQFTGLNGTPEIFNISVFGRKLGTGTADASTAQATLNRGRISFLYSGTTLPVVLYERHGTNDMTVGGGTVGYGATLYGNMTSWISYVLGLGPRMKMIVGTLLPRADAAYTAQHQIERTSYNNLVMANSGGATLVHDPSAISQLSNASNGTYFWSDKIHLRTAGFGYDAAAQVAMFNQAYP